MKTPKFSNNLVVIGDPKSLEFFQNRIVCEWIGSNQAATYLGISENALRIMCSRGKVPFSKFGRRLRFRVDDIKALLSQEGAK